MVKKAEIFLEYQNYFDFPPQAISNLWNQAVSNDQVTIEHWRETWLKNIKANHDKHGPFAASGIGKLFGKHRFMPAVVAGAGPSLKGNAHHLKDKNRGIPVVSCLHNFHFFEDRGIHVDYYVTLDAGPVTIEEVSEGGQLTPEEYWARTKDKKLIAYIGTHPDLIEKWQGEVYWFTVPLPSEELNQEIEAIEKFGSAMSTGGNVLGACTYFAKAVLCCSTLAWIGADFSFSYTEKFHGWDSKYDKKLGQCIKLTDVYGNKVKTWASYSNFKAWFDGLVQRIPGIYFNCTEGGCFGSYAEGNIRQLRQMDLEEFLHMMHMADGASASLLDPVNGQKIILFN